MLARILVRASDIELIPIQKINEAWDRLLKQEVTCRFVIEQRDFAKRV